LKAAEHVTTAPRIVWTARRNAGQFFFALLSFVAIGFSGSARAGEGSAASAAYVTNQIGNSLSVVDLATEKQVAEIAIGGKPAGIALSPDGRIAYVAAPDGREVIAVDTTSRSVVKRAPVGKGPLGIAVNPKTGAIYVADWYEHRLYAVDPATLAVTATVPTGQSPSGVAVTADGATILTADRDSNQVSVIDAATFKVRSTIATGERPFGITIDEAAGRAYTANVAANTVTVIDLASRTRLTDVPVGLRPYAIARAANLLFVTNQHDESVSVIDAVTLQPVKTLRVGGFPEGIEADPTGSTIWVACWDANTLEKIDVATLTVTARIPVGEGPRAFGKFLR
jgi:YVTN family beta-propeller protein